MTKAISVDKNDILLISDLEVGMKTVARNIISKVSLLLTIATNILFNPCG